IYVEAAYLLVAFVEPSHVIARFVPERKTHDVPVRSRKVVAGEDVIGRAVERGPGERVFQRARRGADPRAFAVAGAESAPRTGRVAGGRQIVDVAAGVRAAVGSQHQATDLCRLPGASRAQGTEHLRPDGSCDRLHLRLDGGRVRDGVAGAALLLR